jgi:hypothetical protein
MAGEAMSRSLNKSRCGRDCGVCSAALSDLPKIRARVAADDLTATLAVYIAPNHDGYYDECDCIRCDPEAHEDAMWLAIGRDIEPADCEADDTRAEPLRVPLAEIARPT